jgi:tRNA(adenine34) deaminase
MHNDLYWMQKAVEAAEKALVSDEIPVGGVLVKEDEIVARNHNRTREYGNPLAHVEKLLIEEVLKTGVKYLYDYTLYVTLEPCLMCSGILVLSRIGRVVFGCYDPKSGAAGSLYNLLEDKQLNHNPQVLGGVLEEKCSELLQNFFRAKRV